MRERERKTISARVLEAAVYLFCLVAANRYPYHGSASQNGVFSAELQNTELCLFKGLPQSEFIFLFHNSSAIAKNAGFSPFVFLLPPF